jgi:hypothetical protein
VQADADVFVGRVAEQKALRELFATARSGEPAVALISGVSGMGKTTLARRFLAECADTGALVLRGRCQEFDTTSYAGFDTIIGRLANALATLRPEQLDKVLPQDMHLLKLIFPALAPIRFVRSVRSVEAPRSELRTRAFDALAELLGRLSRLRPTVVLIDDLQWAGRETWDLLLDLTRPPGVPGGLIVGALRAEGLMAGGALADAVDRLIQRRHCREIRLGPLSAPEQCDLVTRLHGDAPVTAELLDRCWEQSGGHPMFTAEIVRLAQHGAGGDPNQKVGLEDVLSWRIDQLLPDAKALLEIVALAGEPMPLGVLGDAVYRDRGDCQRSAELLAASGLARLFGPQADPWLDVYHDRVRETVTGKTKTGRAKQLHRDIALALERWEGARVDSLARHWLAADSPQQAVRYFVTAAKEAADKLAFERAAELYRAALDYGTFERRERRELERARADALAVAGHGPEAAAAYRELLAAASPEDAREMTRLIAEQLLRSGHIEAGLAALQEVLSSLGMPMARTGRRALLSLIAQRMRILVRGLGWQARPESAIPRTDLNRLDMLYAAATSLGMIDHIRGADFQTRQVRMALRLGEEQRVCRALAIEILFRASEGRADDARLIALDRRVHEAAARLDDPLAIGLAHMATGGLMFFGERFKAAEASFGDAEARLRECVGAEWERVTIRFFIALTQCWMGKLNEIARSAVTHIEVAERTRNYYALNLWHAEPNTWRLLRDDEPERAADELVRSITGWPSDRFYMAHQRELFNRAFVHMYSGRGGDALALLRAGLPALRRSMLLRVAFVVSYFHHVLGLAAASQRDVAGLRFCVRRLARYRFPYGRGVRRYLQAVECRLAGDADGARQHLVGAAEAFDDAQAYLFAHATRVHLGRALGGDEGNAMTGASLAWFAEQGVRNPPRFLGCMAAGFDPD